VVKEKLVEITKGKRLEGNRRKEKRVENQEKVKKEEHVDVGKET
tara:strand:- start:1640 stop:1771 length:132 start_codon:yes stop_codon:yes gene_type:complete